MVDNMVKKQADGMEIHFRKEAQFFGYDYDDLVLREPLKDQKTQLMFKVLLLQNYSGL